MAEQQTDARERSRPRQVARRVWRTTWDHGVLDSAAVLAYFVLFSMFPLLAFLVSLTPYLPLQDPVNDLLQRLAPFVPPAALQIITDYLSGLLGQPRPKLLGLGLVVSLWSASRGTDAMRNALNRAYDVQDSRPWWRQQAVAVAMTVAGALLVPLGIAMFVLGGQAGRHIADWVGWGHQFALVWEWLRWPATALVLMFVVALAYYFLPDVEQEFRFITPGSVIGTLLWLLATWGFTQYAEHFGNFDATYGSIGGVVILLTWLYLSGLVYLLGGEINSAVEFTSQDGKAPGTRVPRWKLRHMRPAAGTPSPRSPGPTVH